MIETIDFGSILKKMRQESSKTVHDVVRGLCTEQSLNRFESNQRFPDKFLAQRIFERLGRKTETFEMIICDRDYELVKYWENIRIGFIEGDLVGIKALLEAYEIPRKTPNIHKQMIEKTYGDIYAKQGKYEKAYEKYKYALTITNINVDDFSGDIVCLDFIEIDMLFYTAKILCEQKDENAKIRGIKYLNYLVDYFEETECIQYAMPEIYGKLMLWYAQEKCTFCLFGTAQKAVENGLKVIRKQRRLEGLAELMLEACTIKEKTNQCSESVLKASYYQIYYFLLLFEDDAEQGKLLQHLRGQLKEKYKWDFTNLEMSLNIPENL